MVERNLEEIFQVSFPCSSYYENETVLTHTPILSDEYLYVFMTVNFKHVEQIYKN